MVTITGATPAFTLPPSQQKYYSGVATNASIFGGGEQLVIEASGADLVGFKTTLQAPHPAVIVAPAEPQIDRATDVALEWTGGSGLLYVSLRNSERPLSGHVDMLECVFRAEDGQGVIPQSSLLLLQACSDPMVCRFNIATLASRRLTVGDQDVIVEVEQVSVWSDNRLVESAAVLR